MKVLFFISLFIITVFSFTTMGAIGDVNCKVITTAPGSVRALTGGAYKPSANAPGEYMRALIVFAQFADENVTVPEWPKNQLPNWANLLIDSSPSSSYREQTISDYFKDMSNGDFDFIGDIYPNVITIPNQINYSNANLAVIDSLNRRKIDFKKYDNWKFDGSKFVFSERNGDTYLDMLIIIYRYGDAITTGLSGGIADLGFSSVYSTYDGIKISGTGLNLNGSGITLNTKGNYTNQYQMIPFIAHEYGHYLFGFDPITGACHTRVSGLMVGDPYGYYGGTFAMSAWERNRLGYTSFYVPGNDGYIKTIGDYVTTKDAIKIPIPFGSTSSSEFFIIENHQRLSPYDQIIRGGALQGGYNTNTQIGSGVYVWYVKNGNSFPPDIYAINADGLWNWSFAGWIQNPFDTNPSSQLALIKRNGVNRLIDSGTSDRDPQILYYSSTNWDRWHDINPLTNQWELTREVMGDETDAFNIGYNQYITPWSNPSTSKASGPTNISIELNAKSGTNYTIKVYSTAISGLNLPPSKPQNLSLSANPGNNHNKLTWDNSFVESDVVLYEISRNNPNLDGNIWYVIGTTINNYYVDDEYYYAPDAGDFRPAYRIRAKDSQNLYSMYSDVVTERSEHLGKNAKGNLATKTASWNLKQNYPNPFNPITYISFSIQKSNFVSLKVYDILGSLVKEIVNEIKPAGDYTVPFDGSNLPSGMYIYKIQSGDFVETRKMTLMK